MTIDVFVVRHTPSGKFLPPTRGYGGATRRELSADRPRVFYRQSDAKNAATWWSRGHARSSYTSDWETGIRELADIQSEPVEGRRIEDLKIVKVTLIIDGDL